MCGESHVGLSFSYLALLNMANNTLSAWSPIWWLFVPSRTPWGMSFKLLSRVSAESIPITACMLDPWYKNLKFLPEDIRDDAQARLTRVWEHRKEEQPGATGEYRWPNDNLAIPVATKRPTFFLLPLIWQIFTVRLKSPSLSTRGAGEKKLQKSGTGETLGRAV